MSKSGNKFYVKGRRKEWNICHAARNQGHIAFRSAGSHSPIDVCVIDFHNKEIKLIQSKAGYFPETQKRRLLEQFKDLNGTYQVSFEVI
jgi:hypothetical protein